MTWEHSVTDLNACAGVEGAHVSVGMCMSNPLPLRCNRKQSGHQSFLLLHPVVPCAPRCISPLLQEGIMLTGRWGESWSSWKLWKDGLLSTLVCIFGRKTDMPCKFSSLHLKEKSILFHIPSMPCKCKIEKHSYSLLRKKISTVWEFPNLKVWVVLSSFFSLSLCYFSLLFSIESKFIWALRY